MPRPPVSPEKAARVKALLYEGKMGQLQIAEETGVSQPTVSNIRAGRVFAEVPWPDGCTGGISSKPGSLTTVNMALKEEEDSNRFSSYPPSLQEKMLDAVNEARHSTNNPPLPSETPETLTLITSPMQTPDEEVRLTNLAHQSEVRRKSKVMREFDSLQITTESTIRGEIYKEAVSSPYTLTEEEEQTLSSINAYIERARKEPPTYKSLPWADILAQAQKNNPHIAMVQENRDKGLREAVCIVFAHFPRTSWPHPDLSKRIESVHSYLLQYPDLINSLEDFPNEDG